MSSGGRGQHQWSAIMWRGWSALLVVMVAAAARAALEGDMAELAKMLRESCAGETGVDITLVEAVNGGANLPNDDKLKCYIKCTMETAGMMSEGTIDVDAVVALLPEDFRERNENSLRACGTQKGADDCDTAFKTQQCWQNANRKDYFLI